MTSSPALVSESSSLKSFIRFGGISGLGWLMDFTLLFIFVRWMYWPVFLSNLISASAAALTVFLISRKVAFQGRHDSLLLRTLFYFAYTLGVILLASAAITYLTTTAAAVARHLDLLLSTAACAMIAKIIVTPLNFVANFVVARFTSEHAPATA